MPCGTFAGKRGDGFIIPQLKAQEKRELTAWAVVEHAKGRTYQDIAEEIGVYRQTVSKWIEDDYAERQEFRSVNAARERSITAYETLIRELWKRLDELYSNQQNVPGLFANIRQNLERIDKLTGAEAPIKYQEVEDEIVIEWEDLDNPELLAEEEVS